MTVCWGERGAREKGGEEGGRGEVGWGSGGEARSRAALRGSSDHVKLAWLLSSRALCPLRARQLERRQRRHAERVARGVVHVDQRARGIARALSIEVDRVYTRCMQDRRSVIAAQVLQLCRSCAARSKWAGVYTCNLRAHTCTELDRYRAATSRRTVHVLYDRWIAGCSVARSRTAMGLRLVCTGSTRSFCMPAQCTCSLGWCILSRRGWRGSEFRVVSTSIKLCTAGARSGETASHTVCPGSTVCRQRPKEPAARGPHVCASLWSGPSPAERLPPINSDHVTRQPSAPYCCACMLFASHPASPGSLAVNPKVRHSPPACPLRACLALRHRDPLHSLLVSPRASRPPRNPLASPRLLTSPQPTPSRSIPLPLSPAGPIPPCYRPRPVDVTRIPLLVPSVRRGGSGMTWTGAAWHGRSCSLVALT